MRIKTDKVLYYIKMIAIIDLWMITGRANARLGGFDVPPKHRLISMIFHNLAFRQ
jgi:hypothetical protein